LRPCPPVPSGVQVGAVGPRPWMSIGDRPLGLSRPKRKASPSPPHGAVLGDLTRSGGSLPRVKPVYETPGDAGLPDLLLAPRTGTSRLTAGPPSCAKESPGGPGSTIVRRALLSSVGPPPAERLAVRRSSNWDSPNSPPPSPRRRPRRSARRTRTVGAPSRRATSPRTRMPVGLDHPAAAKLELPASHCAAALIWHSRPSRLETLGHATNSAYSRSSGPIVGVEGEAPVRGKPPVRIEHCRRSIDISRPPVIPEGPLRQRITARRWRCRPAPPSPHGDPPPPLAPGLLAVALPHLPLRRPDWR